jgi:pentatricopeptide repeat-containing protein PET309
MIECFINGEPFPNSLQLVDLKSAWGAFVELRKQSCLPQPSVVLAFVDRALSTVELTLAHENKMRELVRWSVRLRRVLRQLGDIENLPSAESLHVLCLLTRIHALLGRFDDVVSFFPHIWNDRTNEEAYDLGYTELRVVETVLQALARYRSPAAVLDFVVSQWHTLGWLVNMSSSSPPSSPQHSWPLSSPSDIAFNIFDRIPSPVAVIADMRGKPKRDIALAGMLLIRYLLLRRVPEDALAIYREMRRQSVEVKPPLKLWLVRALVQGHAFEQANNLFSEISASVPSGHENDLFLATSLHLFASQGDTARSEAAFQALEDRNMVDDRTIGLRLLAHAHNGDVETVVRYFHHYFPFPRKVNRADKFHYSALLMAHAKAGDGTGLSKWLGNMIADGVAPDRHVYNILLQDCAGRGRLEDVASIIKEMRIRGLPPLAETYTTVITALAKRGDPVTAEAFYKKALREGIKPDRQMVASLMTAHAEVGSWRGVIRVFDYLTSSVDRHLRPRIDIYNILLNAYVLAGSPFEVVSDVFQKMEQSGVRPTAHTFSILIRSACDSGQMDVAMRVFMELDSLAQSWETGLKVNVYALTILMAGYLRIGDRLRAKEIYDEMLLRGIRPTSFTYGSILRAYVSDGQQEGIKLAFDFMKSLMASRKWLSNSHNRFSGFENIYSPLMTLFARKAKPEQVEELMDDMVRAGGERTLMTLTLLLNAYRNAGNVDECRRVWDELFPIALRFLQTGELLGIPERSGPDDVRHPDLKHKANIICVPLSIHMDALSAAGDHAEVAEVWKMARTHGFALDSHNWNHLIVVLIRAGEIERAFLILERVIIPSALFRHSSNMDTTSASRDTTPSTPLSYYDDGNVNDNDNDDDDNGPPPQEDSSGVATIASEEATRTRIPRVCLSATERASVSLQLEKELGADGAYAIHSPTDSSAQGRLDFAHPLHILQHILPSWNTWQPHAAVVTLLRDVLFQLEAGHMIPPISPRRFGDAAGLTAWQGMESEAEAARTLFGTLHVSCPRAVRLVREYEHRIRVRQELANMLDES